MLHAGEERAAHATSGLAERVGRRYFLFYLLLPVIGYLFPLVAERFSPLTGWSGSQYAQILDHGYGLNGQNADVVVFGDSSAIFGVDPVQLSHDLGLKVLNIPGSLGSLPILGDRTLRLYLAGNRAPRLIVFHFTPWDMSFGQSKDAMVYEGEEQVLRHDSLAAIVRVARRRPGDMFLFPFRFYQVPSRLTSLFQRDFFFHPVNVTDGHALYWGTLQLKADCAIPQELVRATGTDSVRRLVEDFSSAETRTLVYLTPIPDCAHAVEVAANRYRGVEAAPPVILPHGDFADRDQLVHALPSATPVTTGLVEAAIRKALATDHD